MIEKRSFTHLYRTTYNKLFSIMVWISRSCAIINVRHIFFGGVVWEPFERKFIIECGCCIWLLKACNHLLNFPKAHNCGWCRIHFSGLSFSDSMNKILEKNHRQKRIISSVEHSRIKRHLISTCDTVMDPMMFN